ncbi:MAG: substrate-binding domain-containing protein [Chloroflexi bacterium]|nr:substrate-binding domain-containing protein [Chloroflexota bacterium]
MASLPVLLAASCGKAPATPPGPFVIRVAAPMTAASLVQALAASYRELHSNTTLQFQPAEELAAANAVRNGAADLALCAAEPRPQDPQLEVQPLARQPIAVIVNRLNQVNVLTTDQLRGLFTGRITDWQALGTESGPVTVVSREDGAPTRTAFEGALLSDGSRVTRNARVFSSEEAVSKEVSTRKGMVGYVLSNYLGSEVKALLVDGQAPEVQGVLDGRYRLYRTLFLVRPAAQSGSTQDFIDYLLDSSGRRVLAASGYAPVNEGR